MFVYIFSEKLLHQSTSNVYVYTAFNPAEANIIIWTLSLLTKVLDIMSFLPSL